MPIVLHNNFIQYSLQISQGMYKRKERDEREKRKTQEKKPVKIQVG